SKVKCNICNQVSSSDKIILDRGCQLDMERLDISCSHCDWNGIFKAYQEHLNTVHLNSLCEHCGEELNTVNALTEHISICEKALINCVLEPYGCNEQFIRMNIRDHFLSVQHQSILLQYLFKNIRHRMNGESVISSRTRIHTDRETDETFNENPQQLLETMNMLLNGISALTDDAQRLSLESFHHQNSLRSLSEESSKLKIAIEETHSSIDAHQTNQQIFEQTLASLQQQLEEQKNISTDGKLIWKITNVPQKI
ncbi:unnamed protein product, partial [Rotaria sp. Silwood1]